MNLNEEISRVAYELYEKSGRIPGRDEFNWLEAEKIVRARLALKQAGAKAAETRETVTAAAIKPAEKAVAGTRSKKSEMTPVETKKTKTTTTRKKKTS
ncbi:MAG: DUF2934 domain-containing protein [Chloroflexota bacterium]